MSFVKASVNRPAPSSRNSKTVNRVENPSADAGPKMTEDYFGKAYQKGFNMTVRFLLSRGLSYEGALDTAQAAWTKGWERRDQLRQPALVLTWTNSIALNIYRSMLRRERQHEGLLQPEEPITNLNVAAIDVERILQECRPSDRIVLEGHYLDGYRVREIAQLQGCSETAIRIRLFRARKKMQHLVSPKRVRATQKASSLATRSAAA
jgi:RNA polymerase sigma-70 factor (ECF subfamily)